MRRKGTKVHIWLDKSALNSDCIAFRHSGYLFTALKMVGVGMESIETVKAEKSIGNFFDRVLYGCCDLVTTLGDFVEEDWEESKFITSWIRVGLGNDESMDLGDLMDSDCVDRDEQRLGSIGVGEPLLEVVDGFGFEGNTFETGHFVWVGILTSEGSDYIGMVEGEPRMDGADKNSLVLGYLPKESM